MKILICGDRHWTDYQLIKQILKEWVMGNHDTTVVIDGMAAGADSMGNQAARELGCGTQRFPARWDVYGKNAGPLRNKEMLEVGRPDVVLAFHDSLDHSKGTAHMMAIAKRARVPVHHYQHHYHHEEAP